MGMEFSDVNTMGGGGFASGLLAGSAMDKRRDDQGQWIWAVIVFIIFVVIALVFLAFMKRDDRCDRRDNGTDIGAMLAPLIAAKGLDCNGKSYDHDHYEIKDRIEHSEDRAQMRKIDSEIGAMGMMMQKTAADNEKENLKEFGEIKQQLGMQQIALQQLLQKTNNQDIINGVIQQLMCGKPCVA